MPFKMVIICIEKQKRFWEIIVLFVLLLKSLSLNKTREKNPNTKTKIVIYLFTSQISWKKHSIFLLRRSSDSILTRKPSQMITFIWAHISPLDRSHRVDKSSKSVCLQSLLLFEIFQSEYMEIIYCCGVPSGVTEKLIFDFQLETSYRNKSQ